MLHQGSPSRAIVSMLYPDGGRLQGFLVRSQAHDETYRHQPSPSFAVPAAGRSTPTNNRKKSENIAFGIQHVKEKVIGLDPLV